jgi:hypothetical protein
MCRGHHHRGRRGYPNREEWAERLRSYREHLEQELKNVEELIERLGDPQPAQTAAGSPRPPPNRASRVALRASSARCR